MKYLTRDDVLDLHTFAISTYGGRLGIKSSDVLQQAVNAPSQVMFGGEMYADLPAKAATITFLLLKNRPFVSANQPTALLVLLRFLAINGAHLPDDAPVDELTGLLRAIDRSAATKDELEAWLRRFVA